VTTALHLLECIGILHVNRAHVRVRDRKKLEEVACQCYRIVRRHYEEMLPKASGTVELQLADRKADAGRGAAITGDLELAAELTRQPLDKLHTERAWAWTANRQAFPVVGHGQFGPALIGRTPQGDVDRACRSVRERMLHGVRDQFVHDQSQAGGCVRLDLDALGLDLQLHAAILAHLLPERGDLAEVAAERAMLVLRQSALQQAQGGDDVENPGQLPASLGIAHPLETDANKAADELERVGQAMAQLRQAKIALAPIEFQKFAPHALVELRPTADSASASTPEDPFPQGNFKGSAGVPPAACALSCHRSVPR
jgi:hypothetical protein